jgi:DHA1 family tetracycline resistance protein-like MFS transporter
MLFDIRKNRRSLFPVLLTYFLDNFGLAIIYPIFTPLLIKTENSILSFSTPYFQRTVLLGLLIAAFPLAQFFGAPLVGQFSDRVGRKRVFYITIGGTALGYTLTAISIMSHSLTGLFISRFATGFFAGNLTLCLATIAHMSHDDTSRTRNFSLLNAIGGLSFIIAIAFGGICSDSAISRHFSPSFPFWVTALFSYVNFICFHLFFIEPHKGPRHPGFNPFRGINHILQGIRSRELRTLYAANFLFMLAWIAAMQLLPAILLEQFKFNTWSISLSLIGISLAWSLSNFLLNRRLAKSYFPGNILFASLPLLSLFLLFTAISPNPTPFVFLFILSACFASLCWTNGIATISLKAPLAIQGSILGINQSVTSIAAMLSPIIGGLLAAINGHLIYAFGAICCIVAFLLLKRTRAYESHSYVD